MVMLLIITIHVKHPGQMLRCFGMQDLDSLGLEFDHSEEPDPLLMVGSAKVIESRRLLEGAYKILV
jgi:hypothetical protein